MPEGGGCIANTRAMCLNSRMLDQNRIYDSHIKNKQIQKEFQNKINNKGLVEDEDEDEEAEMREDEKELNNSLIRAKKDTKSNKDKKDKKRKKSM